LNFKRLLGILPMIIGIGLIIFSQYLNYRLDNARGQIDDAKKKVSAGSSLFSLNPVAQEIGKEITGSAEKKISSAEATVKYYETVADWSQKGGVGLIILGVVAVIFGRKKK
jgi:hypothetical protein